MPDDNNEKKRVASSLDNSSNHTSSTAETDYINSSDYTKKPKTIKHWTDSIDQRTPRNPTVNALLANKDFTENNPEKDITYKSEILDIVAKSYSSKLNPLSREDVINAISNSDSKKGKLLKESYNDIENSLSNTSKGR